MLHNANRDFVAQVAVVVSAAYDREPQGPRPAAAGEQPALAQTSDSTAVAILYSTSFQAWDAHAGSCPWPISEVCLTKAAETDHVRLPDLQLESCCATSGGAGSQPVRACPSTIRPVWFRVVCYPVPTA